MTLNKEKKNDRPDPQGKHKLAEMLLEKEMKNLWPDPCKFDVKI